MSKFSILLVDDEPNVLKSLKRIFIGSGFRVLTASSGKEGLEVCAKENLALIISDYRMPEMTGVQFLAKVKENHPETIRIILSGYADVSAIVEAINDGQVYRFLSKPWNDNELLDTVKHSLEHYRLRHENSTLLAELQNANAELKELTDSLEKKVEDRTRDIEKQTKAIKTSHRILNLLPVGVLGVDTDSTVVFSNPSLSRYVKLEYFMLGGQVEWTAIEGLPRFIEKVITEQTTERVFEEAGIRLICTPLPDGAGVIALFYEASPEVTNQKSQDEAIHAH